jgi:hypothetical protein
MSITRQTSLGNLYQTNGDFSGPVRLNVRVLEVEGQRDQWADAMPLTDGIQRDEWNWHDATIKAGKTGYQQVEVSIPFQDMFDLVMQYLQRCQLSQLEQADSNGIARLLGLPEYPTATDAQG